MNTEHGLSHQRKPLNIDCIFDPRNTRSRQMGYVKYLGETTAIQNGVENGSTTELRRDFVRKSFFYNKIGLGELKRSASSRWSFGSNSAWRRRSSGRRTSLYFSAVDRPITRRTVRL